MSLLHLSRARPYYLHRGKTDMRKGINGLTAIIRSELGSSPLSGDVFIFFNRQPTQVKLYRLLKEVTIIYMLQVP